MVKIARLDDALLENLEGSPEKGISIEHKDKKRRKKERRKKN